MGLLPGGLLLLLCDRMLHAMCRRAEGGDGGSNGASGAFPLPEAPATSMKSIPEHANICREALAEEYDLLPLPTLAVTPGTIPLGATACRSTEQRQLCQVLSTSASPEWGTLQSGKPVHIPECSGRSGRPINLPAGSCPLL